MKKLFIALGTVVAVATPVAAMVSCSSMKSSFFEKEEENISHNITDKSEPKTKMPAETKTETVIEKTDSVDTIVQNTTSVISDSVDNKKDDQTVSTHFNSIEDIAHAFETADVHGDSSQFIEYVTNDQIKDLLIKSLDKKLPDEVKISIHERNNINYSGIIVFKVFIEWNNNISREIPIIISGFVGLNYRDSDAEQTMRENPRLKKAFRGLFNRGRRASGQQFPLVAKNVSDILPSEFAETYSKLSSNDKRESFDMLFHKYKSFKNFWIGVIKSALSQVYRNELEGIRITAEVGETLNSKGKLVFRLFLHDDKAKQSIRSIGFVVSGFKKSDLVNDVPENFQRTVYVGYIHIKGSK